MLKGRADRAAPQLDCIRSLSDSASLSKLLTEAFSLILDVISSGLSVLINPLKRLSPRKLPSPDLFSPGVVGCPELPPREKLPKAPIGEKPADCGAADHGEEGPLRPALKGPVVLRFNGPNGKAVLEAFSCLLLSFSLSLIVGPGLLSLRSVLRLSKEGVGVAAGASSLGNLLPLAGEAKGLLEGDESLVSRRRFAGRVEGVVDP